MRPSWSLSFFFCAKAASSIMKGGATYASAEREQTASRNENPNDRRRITSDKKRLRDREIPKRIDVYAEETPENAV